LVKYALERNVWPRDVRADHILLDGFQKILREQGVEIWWNV